MRSWGQGQRDQGERGSVKSLRHDVIYLPLNERKLITCYRFLSEAQEGGSSESVSISKLWTRESAAPTPPTCDSLEVRQGQLKRSRTKDNGGSQWPPDTGRHLCHHYGVHLGSFHFCWTFPSLLIGTTLPYSPSPVLPLQLQSLVSPQGHTEGGGEEPPPRCPFPHMGSSVSSHHHRKPSGDNEEGVEGRVSTCLPAVPGTPLQGLYGRQWGRESRNRTHPLLCLNPPPVPHNSFYWGCQDPW